RRRTRKDRLTQNSWAIWRSECWPRSTAATIRSRRSVEYGRMVTPPWTAPPSYPMPYGTRVRTALNHRATSRLYHRPCAYQGSSPLLQDDKLHGLEVELYEPGRVIGVRVLE